MITKLEAVQVQIFLGPSLQAGEAQAHIDAGVQVLPGELVHPGQQLLAKPLHQLTIQLWYDTEVGKSPQDPQ